MKPNIMAVFLVAILTVLVGCASPPKGAAYRHEQEFRRQLGESRPVKDFGYAIKDLRFSTDYSKALVIFNHPDTKTRPDLEFHLVADDFGRYVGRSMQPFYTQGTSETPSVLISVDLAKK